MKELEQENDEQTESPEREKMLNTVKVRKGAVHMWATESSNRRVTTQHTLMASTLKTQVSGKVLVVPHFHHFVFCARGGMSSKCDSLYIPFLSCDLSMKGPISVALCPFNVGLSSLGSSTCGILRAQQLTRDDLVKTG